MNRQNTNWRKILSAVDEGDVGGEASDHVVRGLLHSVDVRDQGEVLRDQVLAGVHGSLDAAVQHQRTDFLKISK